jgi:hypothetical protein
VSSGSLFTAQIGAFVEKAKAILTSSCAKSRSKCFRAWSSKAPSTPAGSRAWQVAIGSIPAGTLNLDDKAGTATIAKVTAAALNLEAGEVIYLVNNLPYAQALEYGHSANRPRSGMVRLTMARIQPGGRTARPQSVNK